jgi:hypothetical protein
VYASSSPIIAQRASNAQQWQANDYDGSGNSFTTYDMD